MDPILQGCDMRTNHIGAAKAGNPLPTRDCTKGRQSAFQQAEREIDTAESAKWNAPNKYPQQVEKYKTRSSPAALMKLLVERLAIRLGYQKTATKSLVMVDRLANPFGNWKTVAKFLVKAIPPCYPKSAAKWLAILQSVVLFVATPLLATTPAWADGEAPIAVIYPDIGMPYRDIFTEIISGIEDNTNVQVASYPVNSDTNINTLKSSLNLQHTKVIIALGRQGMKTAELLNSHLRIVVGGVLTVPENGFDELPVISLAPDPALLFARMKALMPTMKRVFVVYDPAFNSWLITLAESAAKDQGLELVAYKAHNLRTAMGYYQKIFSEADGRSDTLWLPQDPTTVDDNSILPLALQDSWNDNLAIFSSNFGYVQRGVLFSLYPDNTGLGKSLAGLAQEILISGDYGKHGLMPLRDVKSAANSRTANHLGINLNRLQSFDRIFPAQ
jgi:putative ABC transport system substrate-binding protein